MRAVVVATAVLAVAVPQAFAATTGLAAAARLSAQIRPGHSVTTKVRLTAASASVELRLRAVSCGSAPTVKLGIDGQTITSRRVTSRRYTTVKLPAAIPAGSHRVALSTTAASRGRCKPAVVVDRIRFHAGAAAAPSLAPGTTVKADDDRQASTPPSVVTPSADSYDDDVATVDDAASSSPDVSSNEGADSTAGSTPEPTVTTPTTAAPAATAPTPTVPAPTTPARPKLRWAPPSLSTPSTITLAQGDQTLSLDTTKDYIIKLGPVTHVGTVKIIGGRNVVMIGGRIALTPLSAAPLALGIKNVTGTVHIEGVEFDGTSGREMDAISIQAPQAVVQVQNVRADGLLGTFNTNHSDVIQPWGGVAKLRVDRLTADSNYQGIFTRPDQGAIGSVELQNVDMAFNNSAATSAGGYLLWMTTGCDMAPTTLSNVYITPRSGKTLASAVWPTTSDAGCPAKLANNKATWPTLPVTGAVSGGVPSGGSFVPAGSVGVGYSTPGYQ